VGRYIFDAMKTNGIDSRCVTECKKCGAKIINFKARCMPIEGKMEFVCDKCFKSGGN